MDVPNGETFAAAVMRGTMEPPAVAKDDRSAEQHGKDALEALTQARRRLQRGVMPSLVNGVGTKGEGDELTEVKVWRYSDAQIRKLLRLEVREDIYRIMFGTMNLGSLARTDDDLRRAYRGAMTFEGMSIYSVADVASTPPWVLIDASR